MEEYKLSGMKHISYGVNDFGEIRQNDYYYVDKTTFIPFIEQSDRYFFFMRPLRITFRTLSVPMSKLNHWGRKKNVVPLEVE